MLFPFDHGLKALREYLAFWGFAKCSQQQKYPKNSASVANAVIILLMLCILLFTHTHVHTHKQYKHLYFLLGTLCAC